MTPDLLTELLKAGVPPALILLFIWLNRNPSPKEQNDPAKQLLAKLDAMEDRIIDLQSEIKVLLDRRK